MTAVLEQISEVKGWADIQQMLENKLLAVLSAMAKEHAVEWSWLNVIVLPTSDHKELNNRFLGHDYATDVLTFPFDEEDGVAGEVYLDAAIVRLNADEFAVPLEQEYARMVIHGALHLIGYDDGSEKERAEMTRMEDHYLRLC